MKKLLKEYLSLTSKEKLNRLRYLRKKVEFCGNDIICYYDYDENCIRELNGNIILKISGNRTDTEKKLIIKQVDFWDDFNNEGLINKEFNDLDYFYLAPKDSEFYTKEDFRKKIDEIFYK